MPPQGRNAYDPCMPTVTVNACPYCKGKSFARFTNLNFSAVLHTQEELRGRKLARFVGGGALEALFEKQYYFALVLCKTCGHAAFFSQDPKKLIESVQGVPPLMIEVKDEPEQSPTR